MAIGGDKFVNVAIRIRPSTNEETSFSSSLKVLSNKPPVLYVPEKQVTYTFDNIFTEESTQDEVYKDLIKPLVDQVIQGYNCTIFAYGQTGTGKTYTMGSNPEMGNLIGAGIISRTLADFFQRNDENKEVELYVSFYEIYNKKVYDLLSNKEVALPVKGFKPQGLTTEKIVDSSEAHELLLLGGRHRRTGKTKLNKESSRSHAIFTILCNVKNANEEVTAKFNLVDLAGSESVRKTGNQGSQFQEGVNINHGLHCIGKVISALSLNSSFIPYRDSMITTILQDSLNQSNFVTLLACVSPSLDDLSETIQTLEFSQKAKKVKNRPEINSLVETYKKENPPISIIASNRCPDTPKPKRGSAATVKTPWKRPYPFYSSTAVKKPRVNSTLLSNVPSTSQNPNDSIFSSIFSSSVSSAQENLSPIFRRFVTALEKTMLEKLEEIRMDMKENIPNQSRVNSSAIPLNMQNEISKIVRSQIEQQMSTRKVRPRSSPLATIEPKRLVCTKQTLNFDENSLVEESNDFVPLKEFSPIPSVSNTPIVGRRSTRLMKTLAENSNKKTKNSSRESEKKSNSLNLLLPEITRSSLDLMYKMFPTPIGRNNSVVETPLAKQLVEKPKNKPNDIITFQSPKFKTPATFRRSMRRTVLTLKKDNLRQESTNQTVDEHVFRMPARRSTRLLTMNRTNTFDSVDDLEPVRSVWRSTRLSSVNTKPISIKATGRHPKELCTEKIRTKMESYIMNILNTGDEKMLQKLATVGTKTANQIYFYRKLHGKFQSFSDLKKVLCRGTAFDRFVKGNFLG